jgi:hypothetical protein
MTRVIAIIAAVAAACASPAWAQSPTSTATSPQSQTLAEIAKAEEARRKSVRKPAKVFTNGSLRPDISPSTGSTPSAPTPAPATPEAGNKTPPAPGTPPAPDAAAVKDQAYWSGRMKAAQAQLERSQILMDSLQSRINALTTDYVNRDDPAQRAKIEGDRKAALAELERVRKEVDDAGKAIKALEDDARRAGVPPGWLRPGA